MAYNSGIPISTDKLSISQGQIQGNFQALGAIAGNGTAVTSSLDTVNGGFKWVYLPSQGATPPVGASFPPGQIGLYSFINASTGFRELYINKTISGPTVVQIPLTAYKNNAITTPSIPPAVTGPTAASWYYLPSGLRTISGQSTTSGGSHSAIIVFSSVTGFPAFTSFITNITVNRIDGSGSSTTSVRIFGYTLSQLEVRLVNGSTDSTFFWSVTGF